MAGVGFRCNLVKNWSGEKMCLVGIWVDCSLGVSVFSRGYSRRRHLMHDPQDAKVPSSSTSGMKS